MTPGALGILRETVRAAWRDQGDGVAARIGFVPRTFAVWALERAGIDTQEILGRGADHLLNSFALYQRIQIAEGNWQAGPGKWKTLPAVYDDPQEVQ